MCADGWRLTRDGSFLFLSFQMADAKSQPAPLYAPDFPVKCERCNKKSTHTCRLCNTVYYCGLKCKSEHAPFHNRVCSKRLKAAHSDVRVGFTLAMAKTFDAVAEQGAAQPIFSFMAGRPVSLVVKYHHRDTVITTTAIDSMIEEMAHLVMGMGESTFDSCFTPGGLKARYVETKKLFHEDNRPMKVGSNETHMRFEFVDHAKGHAVYTDVCTKHAPADDGPA